MDIKILSDKTINKIAAGEVVERPLSVIKELVENSIDAKAKNIIIKILRGGRTLISVLDDGFGMEKDDIPLALTRHATSKLDESNITDIKFFGFRGEALPSIAAVSRMKIYTGKRDNAHGWEFYIEGGKEIYCKPFKPFFGTLIEIRDLFFSTPSRLKFLKSEQSETSACIDLVNRIAIFHKDINFELIVDDTQYLKTGNNNRIVDVLKNEFYENTIPISGKIDGVSISGVVGLPTFNHPSTNKQFFYVNGRVVRDKVLQYAIHVSYSNLVPYKRHPALILSVDIDSSLVDVNVHPTKSEVRFFDEGVIKRFIINTIRGSLETLSISPSTNYTNSTSINNNARAVAYEVASKISTFDQSKKYDQTSIDAVHNIQKLGRENTERLASNEINTLKIEISDVNTKSDILNFDVNKDAHSSIFSLLDADNIEKINKIDGDVKANNMLSIYDLGYAQFQIDKTYIVAKSENSIVIIDQHAAHERITLEKIKKELKDYGGLKKQKLLMPIIMEVDFATTLPDNLKLIGFDIQILENNIIVN